MIEGGGRRRRDCFREVDESDVMCELVLLVQGWVGLTGTRTSACEVLGAKLNEVGLREKMHDKIEKVKVKRKKVKQILPACSGPCDHVSRSRVFHDDDVCHHLHLPLSSTFQDLV